MLQHSGKLSTRFQVLNLARFNSWILFAPLSRWQPYCNSDTSVMATSSLADIGAVITCAVEESQQSLPVSQESTYSQRKRKRAERFLCGRANAPHRLNRSLEGSFNSQLTSDDSQEDGPPARKRRESKRKCCCYAPLKALAVTYEAAAKQPAKTLQYRRASYKPKGSKQHYRSIAGKLGFFLIIHRMIVVLFSSPEPVDQGEPSGRPWQLSLLPPMHPCCHQRQQAENAQATHNQAQQEPASCCLSHQARCENQQIGVPRSVPWTRDDSIQRVVALS